MKCDRSTYKRLEVMLTFKNFLTHAHIETHFEHCKNFVAERALRVVSITAFWGRSYNPFLYLRNLNLPECQTTYVPKQDRPTLRRTLTLVTFSGIFNEDIRSNERKCELYEKNSNKSNVLHNAVNIQPKTILSTQRPRLLLLLQSSTYILNCFAATKNFIHYD